MLHPAVLLLKNSNITILFTMCTHVCYVRFTDSCNLFYFMDSWLVSKEKKSLEIGLISSDSSKFQLFSSRKLLEKLCRYILKVLTYLIQCSPMWIGLFLTGPVQRYQVFNFCNICSTITYPVLTIFVLLLAFTKAFLSLLLHQSNVTKNHRLDLSKHY